MIRTISFLVLTLYAEAQNFPLKVVQIGDSYTAGNGAGGSTYIDIQDCWRNEKTWGAQTVDELENSKPYSVAYMNRACSGGVIPHITDKRTLETFPSAVYHPEEIREDSQRFAQPQERTVDKDTNLILGCFGGNDLNFEEIIYDCILVGFRGARLCHDRINSSLDILHSDAFRDVFMENFGSVIQRMHPEGKYVLASYPHLVTKEPFVLCDWIWGFIPWCEFEYDISAGIRDLTDQGTARTNVLINEINAESGREAMLFYGETSALFEGHEIDPDWWNENPHAWIHDYSFFGNSVEYFHPNPIGHNKLGDAIYDFLDGIESSTGTFPGYYDKEPHVNIAFVIENTSSQDQDVVAKLTTLMDDIKSSMEHSSFALVSYTCQSSAQVEVGKFSDSIDSALSVLSFDANCPQTSVLLGIEKALFDLNWAYESKNHIFIVGKTTFEESNSLSAQAIKDHAMKIGPISLYFGGIINARYAGDSAFLEDTGGRFAPFDSLLESFVPEILSKPHAWVGDKYESNSGQSITFDSEGSFAYNGEEIISYEWDVGDGYVVGGETFTTSSTEIGLTSVFLRITTSSGYDIDSAYWRVGGSNREGPIVSPDCEVDGDGKSITKSPSGARLACHDRNIPDMSKCEICKTDGDTRYFTLWFGPIKQCIEQKYVEHLVQTVASCTR